MSTTNLSWPLRGWAGGRRAPATWHYEQSKRAGVQSCRIYETAQGQQCEIGSLGHSSWAEMACTAVNAFPPLVAVLVRVVLHCSEAGGHGEDCAAARVLIAELTGVDAQDNAKLSDLLKLIEGGSA